MSEPAGIPGAAPRPRLSLEATLAYAVLWVILLVYGWWGLIGGDPTAWLNEPARAAARLANRDLELSLAQELPGGLLATVWADGQANRAESLAYAADIQGQVVQHLAAREASEARDGFPGFGALSMARAQWAVLLAEAGAVDEALAVAADQSAAPGLPAVLQSAYGEGHGPLLEDPGLTLLRVGLRGYMRDRVEWRLALRAGDRDGAQAIDAELRDRAELLRQGSMRLYFANAALVAIGLAVLAGAAATGRLWRARPFAAPWLVADGLGVLVRGDFWNRLYFVGIGQLATHAGDNPLVDVLVYGPVGNLLFGAGTVIAALPLLWLSWRHLLRPHWPALRALRGPVGSPAIAGALAIAFGALAVDLVGTHAAGWATWQLGFAGHWAEGFDETLAWGARSEAILTAADYTLFAPAVEELCFRGLLYFTLRRRLSAGSAALASAAVFSLLHFYSLPGFLMTFWSGFVWALAFERARSLAPGIVAHSIYNALYVAGVVLLYR